VKIKYLIPFFFLSAFFTSCDNRPISVLSGKKMEAVLFDVYVAQTIIDNNRTTFSDSARKADLLNAVFQKHKIDKAVFDSSLVWYSDNLDKYIKINEKVMGRYTKMTEELRTQQAENPEMQIVEAPSIHYPVNNKTFFLRETDIPRNVYAFRADTTLKEFGGVYNLRFNVLGLPSKIRPVVTFCVQGPDTTIVRRDSLRENGFFTMTIGVFPARQVDRIYGSIHFSENHSDMTLFINRFRISRNK